MLESKPYFIVDLNYLYLDEKAEFGVVVFASTAWTHQSDLHGGVYSPIQLQNDLFFKKKETPYDLKNVGWGGC